MSFADFNLSNWYMFLIRSSLDISFYGKFVCGPLHFMFKPVNANVISMPMFPSAICRF